MSAERSPLVMKTVEIDAEGEGGKMDASPRKGRCRIGGGDPVDKTVPGWRWCIP